MPLRSGAIWAAFARLEPFVTSLLKSDFGSSLAEWPESIRVFHREMWCGNFDTEIGKCSALLPSSYDSHSSEMTKAPRR